MEVSGLDLNLATNPADLSKDTLEPTGGPLPEPGYRAIVLVLASAVSPLDLMFKNIWESYMKRMPSHFKVLFVYGNRNGSFINEENKKEYDLYFNNIMDTYPSAVLVTKVIEAMRYIDSKYDYDFLVRTYLSTLRILAKLLEQLQEFPRRLCYAGDGPLPPWLPEKDRYYLSGINTIVNREMVT